MIEIDFRGTNDDDWQKESGSVIRATEHMGYFGEQRSTERQSHTQRRQLLHRVAYARGTENPWRDLHIDHQQALENAVTARRQILVGNSSSQTPSTGGFCDIHPVLESAFLYHQYWGDDACASMCKADFGCRIWLAMIVAPKPCTNMLRLSTT